MNGSLQLKTAKRKFFFLFFSCFLFSEFLYSQTIQVLAPGIWKVVYGRPENYLPSELKEPPLADALAKLAPVDAPPFDLKRIRFRRANGGVLAEMTVDSTERFYGFGMQ